MSTRLDQINRLAAMTPVMNAQAEKQLQAGQQIQLKNAVAQAPLAIPAHRAAQQLAPAATQQAGQVTVATAQQNNQQLGQLGQAAVQQQETDQRVGQQRAAIGQAETIRGNELSQSLDLSRADNALTKKLTKQEQESTSRVASVGMEQDNRLLNISLANRTALESLGRDVKGKILDSRLQFDKDERGRKFSNERQFADYAAATARTEQELQSRLQMIKQESDKKMTMLELLHKRISTELEQGWRTGEQAKDAEHMRNLAYMRKAMEKEIAKQKAKAANNLAIAQGVGMVGGAIVGGIVTLGQPAGIATGASLGGAGGAAVHGATS